MRKCDPRMASFLLRDKSRNGTFLNGARIDTANREAPLNDGDCVAIGHYELSVKIDGDESRIWRRSNAMKRCRRRRHLGRQQVGRSRIEARARRRGRGPHAVARTRRARLDTAFQPAATAGEAAPAFSWGTWQESAPASPEPAAAAPDIPCRDAMRLARLHLPIPPASASSSGAACRCGFGGGGFAGDF